MFSHLSNLHSLQSMEAFHSIDSQVATVALNKLKGHLWYLSEDLVGLSFFSDKVFVSEKRLVVSALSKPQNKTNLRRIDPKTIKMYQEKTIGLRDTAVIATVHLTQTRPRISVIGSWNLVLPRVDDYQHAKDTVAALRVVNDCAERAIKLATDFNLALTQDEDQRQLIFQVVEQHRQQIPAPLKKNYSDI